MADINVHPAVPAPTEGDGISYRGIVWFVVILVATTLVSQVLMWGLFIFFDRQTAREDVGRAPLAMPLGTPKFEDGQAVAGTPMMGPNLMVDDPAGLKAFRTKEDEILTTYGWADKNTGAVRIPIDRAKELLLQRGIPGGTLMAPAPAAKVVKDH